MEADPPLQFEWVHLNYDETAAFTETYGFAGNQGTVNLEGILIRPQGVSSRTLHVMMHPAATLQLLPVPRGLARYGAHVLCAGSRYARNDSACILEKVVLDLGAYIAHAKRVWGYEKIVLAGWSGGGSLSVFYQSQAERPTITHAPAGDPVDLTRAGLIPADAVIYQAAHLSRARVLSEWIDPSVTDERDPDHRDVELDLYAPGNPNRPPYSPEYVVRFRAAQLTRMRRITAWAKETLEELKRRGGGELERGFCTQRTMADPRFLDPTLEPNDRRPGWCYMGDPEAVNTGPVGVARFSTLRAWLSQWSLDDTNSDALRCAPQISAPLLVIENSADDAVPQRHARQVFEAAGSADKRFEVIQGATHYYAGQPDKLKEVNDLSAGWLRERGIWGG